MIRLNSFLVNIQPDLQSKTSLTNCDKLVPSQIDPPLPVVDVELKLREDEDEELEVCSIFTILFLLTFVPLLLPLLLFLFLCLCCLLCCLVRLGAWVDVSDGAMLEGADGLLGWLDWVWASEMTTTIASSSVMVTNLLISWKSENFQKEYCMTICSWACFQDWPLGYQQNQVTSWGVYH